MKITYFTIHFATINTVHNDLKKPKFTTFTIHFATINTPVNISEEQMKKILQYTLLLLIHYLCH